MTRFTAIAHDQLVEGVHAIAAAVDADGWRPTLLVGVGRGGLVPAVYLSHRLGLPLVSIDHSSRIAPFGTELAAALAERTRAGERLLIVEDINDSGWTIKELREALAAAGIDPSSVRFAVLLDNVRSVQRIDYSFRTIDRAEEKDWFVFPWEALAPRAALEKDAIAVPERLA